VEADFLLLLFLLGLLGGFLSGLVGIGGGIIMVPLLLYLPPALGFTAITMKVVAGITSVQSFAGAVSGAFGHNRYQRINKSLVLILGGSMALGSLLGSLYSIYLSSEFMLAVFAGMAIFACIMILIPAKDDHLDPKADDIVFNKPLASFIGLSIGVLAGMIGQGGAFLFIPAMIILLRIPTRIAIGSALAIGIISSLAVLIGRVGTSQIPYLMSAVLVGGVLVGAQLGSVLSQRTPRKALRNILAVVIAGSAVKISLELFTFYLTG
jgi:uncharacterized membrane protein YfcA